MNVLDNYVTKAPGPQNAVDIFQGEWASRLPPPFEHLVAGTIPLFEDARISWAVQTLGGVDGSAILELGPLEAGHTYMLQNAGAASIVAVEANTRAFLKCLIAKELLGINRARFLCGDFVEYLRECPQQFDVCIASGVLYHMRDPLELLRLMAVVCRRLFLWTHYFDRKTIQSRGDLKRKFSGSVPGEHGGFGCTYHRQEYLEALDQQGFCGGSAPHSFWLERKDIIDCLRHFGFDTIETAFEQPDHPNGPAFALVARKTAAS